MKKVLGIIVVVVVLAAIAAPYAIGYRAEQLFRHNVQELDQKLNQRLARPTSIQVTGYDRGYLSSTATTQVTIDDKTFEIDHDIAHGPYQVFGLAQIRSHIEFPADLQAKIEKLFKGPALVARTTIGFLGGYTVNLHSSAFRQPLTGSGRRLVWQGMDATFRRSGSGMHLSLQMPHLEFSQDEGRLALTGLQLSAERPGSYWGGHAQLSAKRFTMRLSDGSQFSTRVELQTRQTTVKDGDQVNSRMVLTLENYQFKSSANASLSGNELRAEPFHLIKQKTALAVKGLDAQKLKQLGTAIRQTIQRTQGKGFSEDMLRQQVLGIIVEYAPKVLTPDSSVVLAVPAVKAKAGTGHAKLTVQLTGNNTLKFNLIALLNRLQVDLDAVADVELVKHMMSRLMPEPLVQMRLTKLRQKQIITKHGDRYQLSFHYENGQYTLNGKPVDQLASLLMQRF